MSELVHCKLLIKGDKLLTDFDLTKTFYENAKELLERTYPGVTVEPQGLFGIETEADTVVASPSITFFLQGVI